MAGNEPSTESKTFTPPDRLLITHTKANKGLMNSDG
jgi:hypothetical protein